MSEFEAPISHREAMLRRAAKRARLGYWRWNTRTEDLEWSDEIYDIIGCNPATTEPSIPLFMSLIHPGDLETVSRAMEIVRQGGESPKLHYRLVRPDGDVLMVEAEAGIETVDDDAYLWGVIQDITEHKKLQDTLEAAKTAAEQASVAKSKFMSSMSHELRTPLNFILGFAQVLEVKAMKCDDASLAEAVGHIVSGGNKLLSLVEDIFDYVRITSGDLKFEMQPQATDVIVRQALSSCEPLAETYHVTLLPFDPGECVADIRVDHERLHQALRQILSNAIKYNRPQGAVRVVCGESKQGMLRITVEDEGEGIAADMVERVFLPFDRIGRETGTIDGTGIGLSIAKDLVELMGGRIGLDSRPQGGTAFWVEFPTCSEP